MQNDEALNQNLTVPDGTRPERIDRWLTRQLPEVSRSQIQQAIRQGTILVNGKSVPVREPVTPGDEISVSPLEKEETPLPQGEEGVLDVLYEDEALLAINKPAGLVVHPAPGHPSGTLLNLLLGQFPDIQEVGGPERPGLVHRLDADTSGVIVFARTSEALQHLQDQFRNRETQKIYRTCCPGIPSPIQQTINLPIGRHPSQRLKRIVNGTGAREAITHFQMVKGLASGKACELEVRIETGRTHQIRVHLTHIGHPVLGDTLYAGRQGQLAGSWPKAPRQMLHAGSITLKHPLTNSPLQIEAPLASDMQYYIDALS